MRRRSGRHRCAEADDEDDADGLEEEFGSLDALDIDAD